jgi:sec-independent protein translocase protein TatC
VTENVPTKPSQPAKPASDPEGRMTFTAHLGELRTRMIRCLVAMVIGFLVCVPFSEKIFIALKDSITPTPASAAQVAAGKEVPVEWMVTTPFEGFMVELKISAYAGLTLALPVIVFQICAFVFPGLTVNEKRMVKLVLAGGTVLAITGVSVAYFGILRTAMPGILSYVPAGVKINLGLTGTLTVILKAMLAFALAFQMPMVVLALTYVGLATPAGLKAYRKQAVVAICIFAAVLTPPDVVSMLMMAIPLYLLYEVSILVSYLVVRRKAAKRERE